MDNNVRTHQELPLGGSRCKLKVKVSQEQSYTIIFKQQRFEVYFDKTKWSVIRRAMKLSPIFLWFLTKKHFRQFCEKENIMHIISFFYQFMPILLEIDGRNNIYPWMVSSLPISEL